MQDLEAMRSAGESVAEKSADVDGLSRRLAQTSSQLSETLDSERKQWVHRQSVSQPIPSVHLGSPGLRGAGFALPVHLHLGAAP